MKIYLLNGVDAGRGFELNKSTVKLGRETDNDVSLCTGGVSRYHAELQRTDSGIWMVSDLGSTNGTKINGKVIERPQALVEGDVISLGDQNIRFGGKKDLALDVAEVLRSDADLVSSVPKVIFHTAPPPSTPEPPVRPVISIKPAETTVALTDKDLPSIPEKTDLSIFENKNLNLFQKKKKSDSVKGEAEKKGRRLSSTLLFYTSIVALIACFAAGFHYFNKETGKAPAPESDSKKPAPPFMLYYVKENVEGDNIFRFSLEINGGKAVFNVDDLKSRRRYTRTVDRVQLAYLEALQREIRKTDFFALEPEHTGASQPGSSSERRLLIANEKKMNDVTVKDTYAPNSFDAITQAIDGFSAHYNLYTIAMTVEEIMKIARDDFNNAEDLYRNRDANPANLLKAIALYDLVVENLDPFQPKPEIWERARKQRQDAEAIRTKMATDLDFEYNRRIRLQDYEGAQEMLVQRINILPQNSKEYETAIERRLKLDRIIRDQRKKR
jgi:hypothetical protein